MVVGLLVWRGSKIACFCGGHHQVFVVDLGQTLPIDADKDALWDGQNCRIIQMLQAWWLMDQSAGLLLFHP